MGLLKSFRCDSFDIGSFFEFNFLEKEDVMGNGLGLLLLKSTCGDPQYKIEFGDVLCRKNDFSDYCPSVAATEIKKYGLALHVADVFKKQEWFLTKKKFLVCGKPQHDRKKPQHLDTIRLHIDVDKNVHFLAAQHGKEIAEWYAMKVDFLDGEVVVHHKEYWVTLMELQK